MKNKIFLLLINTVLSATAVAACPHTHRLINEDRIWEYRIDDDWYRFDFKMRFDGMKSIEGKDYHVFRTIESTGSEYS